MGGDCECMCTAIAAYAEACNANGVHIKWRTQQFCRKLIYIFLYLMSQYVVLHTNVLMYQCCVVLCCAVLSCDLLRDVMLCDIL